MKVKVKERVNWPITILLILGLVTVIFPLYLTVVIAFKKPSGNDKQNFRNLITAKKLELF